MTRRKPLVAVGRDSDGTPTETDAETASAEAIAAEFAPSVSSSEDWDSEEVEAPLPGRFDWIAPTLAIAVALGWTAFFGWVHREALLAGASPLQWSRWIADWAVPVVLVAGLWLIAMRNSRRESNRFASAARALALESQSLESRLVTVNRELSLAREFIAAQSRDLESLGRLAVERLSTNADKLQSLIHDNSEQVETIGKVSEVALGNMTRLRDDLPVIANSARDVTSQIGHAGETAQGQLEALNNGFIRLNEMGEASGQQVVSLGSKVDETVATLRAQAEAFEEAMTQRFTELSQRSQAFRAELDGREVEAFAAMRRRIDALTHEVGDSRDALTMLEQAALTALGDRMARFNTESREISERLHATEQEQAVRWHEAVEQHEQSMREVIARVSEFDDLAKGKARDRLAALHDESERLEQAVGARIAQFEAEAGEREAAMSQREVERLAALEARLAALDAHVTEREEQHLAHVTMLAERSEALAGRLGEMSEQIATYAGAGSEVHSALSESAAALAERLSENRATLTESEQAVARLTEGSVRLLELLRSSAEHTGESLPRAIDEAEARLRAFDEQARSLGALIAEAGEKGATLAAHVTGARSDSEATRNELAAHEARLRELAARSGELSERARSELGHAVETLEAAAAKALGGLQDQQAAALHTAAEQIGADSGDMLAKAMRERAETAIAELDEATRKSNETARDAASHLRDQLSRVNELTGNLEQRIAHARQRAEEAVDNDFTRRMALITESLNSSAIDLAKLFDTEVTDTAWASYLRGDRGIFTRRAVKLLNTREARALLETYEADGEFRETVNRYIHDFEAMLRTVLSTRDGHALAVTLLSSDVGKLYVALAQAIERLRS